MKKAILVEPEGSYKYVPIGLLKIAKYLTENGYTVRLHRCNKDKYPNIGHYDRAYVTSLFTWEWEYVWKAVKWVKNYADKVLLGGIYASLLPEHAEQSGADKVVRGVIWDLENIRPLYELVPECDYSIVHLSRGCIRRCKFCAVPRIEGKLREKDSLRNLVYPRHKKIIFFDNNILAHRNWDKLYRELLLMNKLVDFNQGLDARLIDEEKARQLSRLRLHADEHISIRLALDNSNYKKHFERAAELLKQHKIHPRRIMVYVLYNFEDDPDDFFDRVRTVLSHGFVAFPMRYQHIELPEALTKDSYIGKKWTKRELDMVDEFIWKHGRNGSLPPYLAEHFNKSKDFYDAFGRTLHNTKLLDFVK